MSEKNLQLASQTLIDQQRNSRKARRKVAVISGEPYYQIYKNFDYWLRFNNQNSNEEKSVKLLLCLPLIPPRYHAQIRLSSLRLRKRKEQSKSPPRREQG